jgi:hypothetical protein
MCVQRGRSLPAARVGGELRRAAGSRRVQTVPTGVECML